MFTVILVFGAAYYCVLGLAHLVKRSFGDGVGSLFFALALLFCSTLPGITCLFTLIVSWFLTSFIAIAIERTRGTI